MILFYIYCVYFLLAISSFMVVETGRNGALWGFVTFFLTPVVTIIFLLFLGETEEVKAERAWQEKINRMFEKQREELKKDWEELRAFRQNHCS